MGFRFRRSFKIAPGVRFNLSKSGTSVSLGGRGATVNVGGKNGPRATVGIPGTGLSFTESLASNRTEVQTIEPASPPVLQSGWDKFFYVSGQVLGVVTKVAGVVIVIGVAVLAALLLFGGSDKRRR